MLERSWNEDLHRRRSKGTNGDDRSQRSAIQHLLHERGVPRRPRSLWSKINRTKVAALIDAGRMQAPGHAEIDRAKQDGRWDAAYDGGSNMSPPMDLQEALDKSPTANAFFATLSAQNRYAILFRLHTARRAETRAKKLAEFLDMLEKGKTIYQ